MNARPNGIWGELTRLGNFDVAQATHLAHQEYISRIVIESRESLIDDGCGICGCEARVAQGIGCQRLGLAVLLTPVVVNDKVAGDPKDPGTLLVYGGRESRRRRNADEHILGQIPCGFSFTHRPVEVPEQAVLMGRKQRLGVNHSCHYL